MSLENSPNGEQSLQEYYFGLPIPDETEHEELEKFLFGPNEDSFFTSGDLTEMIEGKQTNIVQVQHIDFEIFRDSQSRPYSSFELEQIREGILAGYEFMIGAITYVHFLRSGHTQIGEFLDALPKDSPVVPLRKTKQRNRFLECLRGEARMEADVDPDEEGRGDSRVLAENDMETYKHRAPSIARIISAMISRLTANAEGEPEERYAYLQGFMRGADNCVEMYIQSQEQDIIDNAETELKPQG